MNPSSYGAFVAASSQLQHAYLIVHEPSSSGSMAAPGPEIERINFQFNPKQLELNKEAKWSRGDKNASNKSSSPPQFKGAEPSIHKLEMILDASADLGRDVMEKGEKLLALAMPTDKSIKAKKPSPPWLIFRWGEFTSFLSVVTSVKLIYTLFTPAGIPIRATCTVTMEELSGQPPKQNPTSGTPIPDRSHQVVEGDTLPAVAYREYGVAALWRAIAKVNGIDDPMRLRPGQRLLLPPLAELTAMASRHSGDTERSPSHGPR